MEPVRKNQDMAAIPKNEGTTQTNRADYQTGYTFGEFLGDLIFGIFRRSRSLINPIVNLASPPMVINISYFSRLTYLDPSAPDSACTILNIPPGSDSKVIEEQYKRTIEALETIRAYPPNQKNEVLITLIDKTHEAYRTLTGCYSCL